MPAILPIFALMASAGANVELRMPILVSDGSKPINVDIGHAAPWVHDMDKDGLPDLLVGQFGDGKLRVYKNVGSREAPSFSGFKYLAVNGQDVTVPYG
jgi:hypothetical protein